MKNFALLIALFWIYLPDLSKAKAEEMAYGVKYEVVPIQTSGIQIKLITQDSSLYDLNLEEGDILLKLEDPDLNLCGYPLEFVLNVIKERLFTNKPLFLLVNRNKRHVRIFRYEGIGAEITDHDQMVMVTDIDFPGPAYDAQLEIGDVILKVNGVSVTKSDQVARLVHRTKTYGLINLEIKRGVEKKLIKARKWSIYGSSIIRTPMKKRI